MMMRCSDSGVLVESYHQAAIMPRVTAALTNKCPVVGKLKNAPPKPDDRFFLEVRKRVDEHLKSKGLTRTTNFICK